MNGKVTRWLLLVFLSGGGWLAQPRLAAQNPADPQGLVPDYTRGPSWFPAFFQPYQQQPVAPFVLENSRRLQDLIRDGKLELSLADALALVLENNLDIAIQRYVLPMAQADVLRAKSGQAARGISGASVPGGLTAGALGAGITESTGGGGVGSAGGITGGGGSVFIPRTGSFDPAVSFGFSWDRVTSPLNTVQVSGIPTVTGYATALSGAYTQLFGSTGTSYFLALSGIRQSSTQQFLLFNPAVVTRFTLGFNQPMPLFSGFGRLPNERFLLVAQNNLRLSEEVFRQQVVATIVQVENMYWDLAASQENVRVAEQSLAVSNRLLEDNRKQAEIGTLAPLDVVAAQAEVAGRQRDLVVAETNLQLQETRFKNILSKRVEPEMDSASVVLTDRMPEPRDTDIPVLQDALDNALRNRPDLRQSEGNLQNQDISLRFTKQSLLPSGSAFGMYGGSGLQGETALAATGAGDSLRQSFAGDFPEYAGGISLSFPIRNRSAQADNLRAQLESNQMEVSLQRLRNQVTLEVRQAITGLVQGKAQVEAAHEAVRLARETWEAEQKKLAAGVSTPYQVILRERDYRAAQQAEVQTVANYAKALVEIDRAMGTTLDRNGIQFQDAVSGTVSRMPAPPISVRGFTPEGR